MRAKISLPLVAQPRAAELLGVSEYTLEDWRKRGVGPHFTHLGRAVRYSLADLEAFAAEGLVETTGGR